MIDKIHLSEIIDALTDTEKKIITLRYFRDKTQSEIANILGVSQVQVSRLESKILLKIKENY
jgi:RNA polymerase sporulation-specific sigma factor